MHTTIRQLCFCTIVPLYFCVAIFLNLNFFCKHSRHLRSAVRLSVLTLACYTAATHSDGRTQCVVSRAIAAHHGHILRRERRANIKPRALTTHDLAQVASYSLDVSGMAEVGRGGSTYLSRSDGD